MLNSRAQFRAKRLRELADHKTAQTADIMHYRVDESRLGLAKRQIEGADDESSPVNSLAGRWGASR